MTQGEINASYYDNCGIFDNNLDNDCIQDCFGVWGGEATLDICENCGGNGPKENMDCDGNCLVQVDCFGICGGEAKLDDCGKCDEDETNNCSKSYFDKCGTFDNDITNDCVEDCVGIWGGTVRFDGCGVCGGDNSSCADCAGIPYGNAVYDNCGICDDNLKNDCTQDCSETWGGILRIDGCGVCGGDNSSCADCVGIPYGNAVYDNCGICDDNLNNDCIQDCAGTWGGILEIDECGECGGIGISEDYCNCNQDIYDCKGVCGGASVESDCVDQIDIDINIRTGATLDQNIYFNRTISYYDFFPDIINPFYEEIENLPLLSTYNPRSYHALNTTKELKKLSNEIHRVLKPGGINIYTVRHTEDADYGIGVHRGEDLYETGGFIVHFFSTEKIKQISSGFNILNIESFEEGTLPRKLFQVTLRKK